jgi:uncharacterized protein (UPF0332 family)
MDDKALELANYRIERAKSDLADAELLYKNNSLLSANNRAYYAIFHAIKAVLALERIDFKRHKDATAYFNKNYVHTNIFPRNIGRKIGQAFQIREDSDYDYKFIPKIEQTQAQIETAKELIELVEKYLKSKAEN